MTKSWVWLAIGMTALAGHQQADVPPPSREDLLPSLCAGSHSALELTEVATYTLPPGVAVAGATLSPDGARVVVWGSQPKSVLYFERGVEGVHSVSPESVPPGEIAGVAFLDDARLEIIHAEGRVSTAEWGHWKNRIRGIIPVSGIRSAALGDDGWWLLAEGSDDDAALHFLPGEGGSTPRHIMPLAASPDRAFWLPPPPMLWSRFATHLTRSGGSALTEVSLRGCNRTASRRAAPPD